MVNFRPNAIFFPTLKRSQLIHRKFSTDSDTTSYKIFDLEKFIYTGQFRRKFALLFTRYENSKQDRLTCKNRYFDGRSWGHKINEKQQTENTDFLKEKKEF